MKQMFHRWDYLSYKDFLVGEWRKAEVIRVTKTNDRIYYILRDLETNEIQKQYTPKDVRPIPGFLRITKGK